MKVTEIIRKASKPLFTFELLPPLKGHTMDAINAAIEAMLPYDPAYINITSHQEEVLYIDRPDGLVERRTVRKRPGTVAMSAATQYKYNIPVIPHMICGGKTKDQIEDQLMELNFLGLDNVFALRGDPPKGERRFVATKNGHEYTSDLVTQIAAVNRGEYLDPTLKNPSAGDFCIGVAAYPEKHFEAPNLDHDIAMLKKKVDAGADYIVTQMFFINDHYFAFVEKCRAAGISVPIIPGIKPIRRRKDIEFIPQTFHIDLPGELIKDVAAASSLAEIKDIGVEFCKEQVRGLLKFGVLGIHFYSESRAEQITKVIESTF